MDFAYSDEQRSVLDLAKQILSDGATGERMIVGPIAVTLVERLYDIVNR